MIGSLPFAVVQACWVPVRYLPGLAMRRIADLPPGEATTDARDAVIIAEAARTMPHTLRSIEVTEELVAELSTLCGLVAHRNLECRWALNRPVSSSDLVT
ncbi:IS110 family transposase [Nesterenkonia sp. Hz 6-5]|nr:IS110 family transposase [Nesterenkonia haasae]